MSSDQQEAQRRGEVHIPGCAIDRCVVLSVSVAPGTGEVTAEVGLAIGGRAVAGASLSGLGVDETVRENAAELVAAVLAYAKRLYGGDALGGSRDGKLGPPIVGSHRGIGRGEQPI